MKRYIFLAAVAVVSVFSACSRSEMPGKEDASGALSGKHLKAVASIGEGVKSHFGSDGYNLVWDSTDKLLVYSSYLGTWDSVMEGAAAFVAQQGFDMESATDSLKETGIVVSAFNRIRSSYEAGKQRSGVFSIDPSGAGKACATFTSDTPAEDFFGETNPPSDGLFFVNAFYPAPETPPAMKFFCYEEFDDEIIKTVPYAYFTIEVPAVQDGVHYQDYQFLQNVAEKPLYTRDGLMNTDEMLVFDNFKPLTSILEFTLGTTDDITAEVDHIDITLSTKEFSGLDYVSDKYMIAGKAPLFFTWDEEDEMHIWNRACKPFMAGFGSDYYKAYVPDPDGWEGVADATSTLRIQFDTPVTVSKTQSSAKYYAVMFPSRCAHFDGDNPILTFDAYNKAGDKILTQTKTTTSREGILEGRKYSFDLTLDTYYGDDVLSGLFSVAEGKQVYIANGNLQAYWNGTDVETWRFAPHQYDIVGGTSYDLANDTGWFDLFSFSLGDATDNNNFGITNSTDPDDFKNRPARGWTEVRAAQGNHWRTITADEGVYLFAQRANAEDLFSYATVYYGAPATAVYGLIFLPDNWSLPSGCNFNSAADNGFSWQQYYDGSYPFDYAWNEYSASGSPSGTDGDWGAMQAAGAVFWPVAGIRTGTAIDPVIGAYWSGSLQAGIDGEACLLKFTAGADGYFDPNHFPAYLGACVRLVKDFN